MIGIHLDPSGMFLNVLTEAPKVLKARAKVEGFPNTASPTRNPGFRVEGFRVYLNPKSM